MEEHSTLFAKSNSNKLLRNATAFNEIDAASRMNGSKWRQNVAC